ncbi:MAG: alpha-glucosidase [Pseudomonadota bacterium]
MNIDVKAASGAAFDVDHDWWRGAVIYQIYPRSFQDTSGDGVGDLRGITARLDHVARLGVDAIWISPFFTSPMLDFGYDVSDYCDVDPMFGTLADFDGLVARARELGIKVLIDLVLSHTSDQHPWFAESRASTDNPKSDWYVWADAGLDGAPPNNWLSIFGGSAWQWDGRRLQYYMHNFLKEQPDLNLHNPDVQNALLDVTRFWLDRGVDGFRLDTINFYFHDPELRSNPGLTAEERNSDTAPAVNPYNWQNHIYDKSRPENLAFLKRFRAVLDEYPGTTAVGEVGDAQRGLEIQAAYTSGGDKVHMCYGFDFLSPVKLTGTRMAEIIGAYEEAVGDGWACWAFSNHDVERHASRWGLTEPAQKAHAALLLSLRGTACIYQGEELGLREAKIAFEDLQDPYGVEFWPEFQGRDGCRTPMPWDHNAEHGGFTSAKPWLPVATEHMAHAANLQAGDDGSLLAFYKAMIAFRRGQIALQKGEIEILLADEHRLAFLRHKGPATLFAAFNLSDAPQRIDWPEGHWALVEGNPFEVDADGEGVSLPPWSAAYASPSASLEGKA